MFVCLFNLPIGRKQKPGAEREIYCMFAVGGYGKGGPNTSCPKYLKRPSTGIEDPMAYTIVLLTSEAS